MASGQSGVSGLSGRYATALFELAERDGQLNEVAGDLASLDAMLNASDDLARLVRSPVMSRDDQSGAMAAVMEAAGLSPLTRNFVGVVAESRRLFALAKMIRDYRTLLADHRGETTAEVTSAAPLSDAHMKALGDALKQAFGTEVSVEATVDPGVIGGLVVKVGSLMVDSSIRTKLQQLRLAMTGP